MSSYTLTPEQQRQVAEVLATFDFALMRRIMVTLDWRWSQGPGQADAVPTVDQIRAAAREKLEHVMGPYSSGYIASGGLVARRELDTGFLSLSFEAVRAGSLRKDV